MGIKTNSAALISPRAAREISGGISDSTQRRMIAAGTYPSPVVLSRCKDGHPARVAFVESEVRAWAADVIRRARTEQTAAPARPAEQTTAAPTGARS
jgi:predicted DNA-binding transcriptional regulator AlpA